MPDSTEHDLCAVCQERFRKRTAHQIYCSRSCNDAVKRLRRRKAFHCEWCSHEYLAQPKSPSQERRGHRRLCKACLILRPSSGASSPWPRASAPLCCALQIRQCRTCASLFAFRPGHTDGWFCSHRCRAMVDRTSRIEYGNCRRCALTFVRRAGQRGQFCGKRCRDKHHERTRRMRKRTSTGQPYTIREIANRDKWTCHLCGLSVPDKPWSNDPKDATVDLVPVSCGGVDEAANVRLAHFICNSRRGTAGPPLQLALLG
jgi:hypothetical protein